MELDNREDTEGKRKRKGGTHEPDQEKRPCTSWFFLSLPSKEQEQVSVLVSVNDTVMFLSTFSPVGA